MTYTALLFYTVNHMKLITENLLIWCICNVTIHFKAPEHIFYARMGYLFISWSENLSLVPVHWNHLKHKFLIYMRWDRTFNLFIIFLNVLLSVPRTTRNCGQSWQCLQHIFYLFADMGVVCSNCHLENNNFHFKEVLKNYFLSMTNIQKASTQVHWTICTKI